MSICKFVKLTCAVVFSVLALGCASRQDGGGVISDRGNEAAVKNAFVPKEPETWQLSNGLSVMFLRDSEVPVVSGTLYLRGGGLWETDDEMGITSAMGQLLRAGGTRALSPDRLDHELEELSAQIGSSYAGEFGSVSFRALKGDIGRVFALFSDVLLRPRFDAGRLDLWKGQAREEIRRRKDDPWQIAGIAFTELVFGDSAYGRVLVEEDLKRITRESIDRMYRRLVKPDGGLLVVVGDISREDLNSLLERELANWAPRGRDLGAPPPLNFRPTPGIYFIEKPLSQAAIYIGHQGVGRFTPDQYKIEGFNEIFGSPFFGSRLVKKVRTEMGLAYFIHGSISPGLIKGRNFIAFQTKGESVGAGISAAVHELLDLKSTPPSDEDLTEVKRAMTSSFIFNFDSSEKTINRRATQKLLGFPDGFDSKYINEIQDLTPSGISEVANSRWDIDKFVVVVVGNQSAFDSISDLLRSPPDGMAGLPLKKISFDQTLHLTE